MTKLNKYCCCILLLTTFNFIAKITFAQKKPVNNETAAQYVERLNKMVDSLKTVKKERKSNKENKSSATGYSKSMYDTNKNTIDNTYKNLTEAEKLIVKNFPSVPAAFRTNIDAEIFLNEANKIDFNKYFADKNTTKSMSLTGYIISYQALKTKAQRIVKEAESLKLTFNKNNPSINFGANVGKIYVSENGLVYLPLGDVSFADEVIEAKFFSGNIQFPKENCLNKPDYVLMKDLKKM
jgi:hypothetical protein